MNLDDFRYYDIQHPRDTRVQIAVVSFFVLGLIAALVYSHTFHDNTLGAIWCCAVTLFPFLAIGRIINARRRDEDRGLIFIEYKQSFDEKAPEKTIKLLDDAIVLDPAAPWPYAMRGIIFYITAEHGKAWDDFDKLNRLCPFSAYAHQLRGKFLEKIAKYALAFKDYKTARLLGGDSRMLADACERVEEILSD